MPSAVDAADAIGSAWTKFQAWRGGLSVTRGLGSAMSVAGQAAAAPFVEGAGALARAGAPQAVARGAASAAVTGARGGASAAGFMARQGAAVGVGLGLGAVRTAAAAVRMGYRGLKFMGGGRIMEMQDVGKIGGMMLKKPQLRGGVEDALIGGAIGLGVLGAIGNQLQGEVSPTGWQLTQSAANGQLEIENPNFLSATGSLTLALHYNRYGRKGIPEAPKPAGIGINRGGFVHLADDALIMASRMMF